MALPGPHDDGSARPGSGQGAPEAVQISAVHDAVQTGAVHDAVQTSAVHDAVQTAASATATVRGPATTDDLSHARAAARLDREGPVPLWAQLLQDIRRRLDAGEFTARLPTEAELTSAYGVSRQTVREALRRLVAEGRLDRQRGRGTEIRQLEFEQPVGGLSSLFRLIEAEGVVQSNQVVALDERRHEAAARSLGLAPDAVLVFLERLRLAGERPLALDRAWMPAELARPLLEVDFRRTALYDELARWCGVHPDRGVEEVRPVLPGAGDRRLLRLGPRSAALAVERRTWAGERPVELRRIILRGDRIGMVARWPMASDGDGSGLATLHLAPLPPPDGLPPGALS